MSRLLEDKNTHSSGAAQPSDGIGVEDDMTAVASLERDAELMLRVRCEDQASFQILLERHRGSVVQVLGRMVHNPFLQEEDGIRDWSVTGVQTCALPI